jgi:hypothetical protein
VTLGRFCFQCGQKRPVAADLSLRHAGVYVVEELLSVDGRIASTVKMLFTQPWQLALDFLAGRRARYVHPLRLFLTFSAAFFLLQGSTMTTAFDSALGARVTASMRTRAQAEGVPFDTVVKRNDQRLAVVYKTSFIAGTLLTGVWLWIFFRKEYPYIAQHMVVALYFACLAMATAAAGNVIHVALGRGPMNPTAAGGGGAAGSVLTVMIILLLGPMITRIYLREKKGVGAQFALGAVVLLAFLSVMVLPAFAASRYLHTLLQ